ncbi:hypothetical protein ABPG74_005672 [Tetrahymena malaccensis]
MSFQIDLFMSCPGHDGCIPIDCQTPHYWVHNCENNKNQINWQVNDKLEIFCPVCKNTGNLKNYLYYCSHYGKTMPYNNKSPQANILIAQQLANPKLTSGQRQFTYALLNDMRRY